MRDYETIRKEIIETSPEILVVIPWRRQGSQGKELQYAVAGWQRHFQNRHRIIVAGEDDPKLEGVEFIYSKRVDDIPGQYRQHLDYVSCFKKVRAKYPDTEGFVFAADDVYAIHDFDIHDIIIPKRNGGDIVSRLDSPNAWQRDKAKTKEALLANGNKIVNYTTHLPQWYNWELLAKLWEIFDMEHESYLIEDLYYNIYYPNFLAVDVRDVDEDNPKNIYLRGVYRPNPNVDKIKDSFGKRIWINNSVEGWCPALDQILKEYYGI